METALKSGILLVCILGLLAGCSSSGTEGSGSVQTQNYANRQLNYYYYIPDAVKNSIEIRRQFLICMGGLNGKGEKFVPSIMKKLADEHELIIVAPSFVYDEDNWSFKRSYQYPSVWSGSALLQILKDFNTREGISHTKLLMYGASAGAQFSLRFSLWRPDLVLACAEYGTGGTVEPLVSNSTKYLIGIGKKDTTRHDKARLFTSKARLLGISVEMKEYNSGHELPGAFIRDSHEFFRNLLR